MEDKICVAKITRPQGVRGELRIDILMNNEESFGNFKELFINGYYYDVVDFFRVGKEHAIKIKGIDTYEDALKFKNQMIYVSRSEASLGKKDNEYFIVDLIGKVAVFEDGQRVGIIDDVESYPANDVVIIKDGPRIVSFANIGGVIEGIKDNKVILNRAEFEKLSVEED